MAFHALIVVPLSDGRPGGPSGRGGACHARAAQPGFAREFTIRTSAHVVPACQCRLPGISVNRLAGSRPTGHVVACRVSMIFCMVVVAPAARLMAGPSLGK